MCFAAYHAPHSWGSGPQTSPRCTSSCTACPLPPWQSVGPCKQPPTRAAPNGTGQRKGKNGAKDGDGRDEGSGIPLGCLCPLCQPCTPSRATLRAPAGREAAPFPGCCSRSQGHFNDQSRVITSPRRHRWQGVGDRCSPRAAAPGPSCVTAGLRCRGKSGARARGRRRVSLNTAVSQNATNLPSRGRGEPLGTDLFGVVPPAAPHQSKRHRDAPPLGCSVLVPRCWGLSDP